MPDRSGWFGGTPPRELPVADESRLADARENLSVAAENAGSARLAALLASPDDRAHALTAMAALSPYLESLAVQRVALLKTLFDNEIDAVIAEITGPIPTSQDTGERFSEADLMARLRKAKGDGHLLIALADLAGRFSVSQTTQALSRLASSCLQAAVDWMLLDLHDSGKIALKNPDQPSHRCGISILAMGKFGAGELNYSSDIDLIIIYDPASSEIDYRENSPGEIVTRMARRLVKIMQERTGDGYVFRTDLRLRPDPGATPLAISYGFAMGYYESRGQNWERAAMIKAAPVAGDVETGRAFLKELTPFIWRRYLDYAAIADIQSIKRQIHAHRGHGSVAVEGHNVKLGRGGIREIEFFVQTQQLIAGGRDPDLRGLSTVAMLAELAEKGWITNIVAVELTEAYGLLRRVEHAIQMIADEQSHTLPDTQEALADIASLLGFHTLATFREELMAQLSCVERHFGELFENEAELGSDGGNLSFTGDDADPSTVETLSNLGYERPLDMWGIIRTWHSGRYRALQWEKARERLTELTPFIISEFSQTRQPDATMVRFDALLARLPAGMQLFSLLQSNPHTLRLLATILASAPSLADTIIEYPLVFDGLLDPAFVDGVPEKDELRERLDDFLGDIIAYEERLDRLRIFAAEQRFLISVRLLTGAISPREAGHGFSDLADLAVQYALGAAAENIREAYGVVPGAQIAIVALGRLGSREMTSSSDLDLIMLYDVDDPNAMSDGERPLAVSQYYARLTQRLIAALSAPMAQGVLYELDFRLRPSGNKGPLATSLASFRKYQMEDAWTWEHMVLCRARVVCGDPEFAVKIDDTVMQVLDAPRNVEDTRKAAGDMRLRLAAEKPGRDIFDVKRISGGTTDIDFIAQFCRLTALRNRNLRRHDAAGTLALLDGSPLSAGEAETLIRAFEDYTAIIQMVRLCSDEGFDPDKAPRGMTERILAHFDVPDVEVLKSHLEATRHEVAKISHRVLGIEDQDGKREASA